MTQNQPQHNDPYVPQHPHPQPPQQYMPQQPVSPYPVYAAPPPKKSNAWKWLLGGFLAIVLLCGGGFVACTALFGSAANEVDKQQKAKVSHVKLTGCNVQRADSDFLPNVKVDLEINNASKDQETYFVDVFIFNASNERVGNGTAMVTDVRPGQIAKHTEMVLLTKQVSGSVKCTVDKVS